MPRLWCKCWLVRKESVNVDWMFNAPMEHRCNESTWFWLWQPFINVWCHCYLSRSLLWQLWWCQAPTLGRMKLTLVTWHETCKGNPVLYINADLVAFLQLVRSTCAAHDLLRNNILQHAYFQHSYSPSSSYVCLSIYHFYATHAMCREGRVMLWPVLLRWFDLSWNSWNREHIFLTPSDLGLRSCWTT